MTETDSSRMKKTEGAKTLIFALVLGAAAACSSNGGDGAEREESGGSRNSASHSGGASSAASAMGSGGGEQTLASDADSDAIATCAEFAAATCHKLATCNAWYLAAKYGDEAACQARRLATSDCVASFGLRGSKRTIARLQECTAALERSTCEEWENQDPEALASCTVEPGELPNGTGCGAASQCQSGNCRFSDNCGICAPISGAGEACSGSDPCGPGLRCSNGVCVSPGDVGAACQTKTDCLASLTCSSGRCMAPKTAGQPCSGNDCDGWTGYVCIDGVCRKLQFVGPGERCDLAEGIDCGAGGFCRTTSTSSAGTCVAPARDGEACDYQRGPQCTLGAYCSEGFCKVWDAAACR